MATATKTPAKRATSQTNAAAAPKSTRTSARTASSAVKAASSKGAGAAAKTAAGASKKTAVKRALNGTSAHAPVAKRGKASSGRTSRSNSGSSNGALPAELAGDVQEIARVAKAQEGEGGEIVRKTRASSAAGGEAASASEVAVPVQIGGLAPEVTRPDYWDKACADLVKRDRILKKLIPKFGPVHLLSRGDPFVTLARSVVGQQISVASAQAVWAKVAAACPKLVPQQFIKLGQEKLTACGLSRRKAEYVLDLAQHFVSGALHVGKWRSMEDEAVIAELTQIRGIGRWTAEMFLIFNLSRPDVLPLDDLGLIRAISVNYFSGEPVTRSEAREVAANWEPWRTVATWYMWRSLDPLPVDY
ncbi:MULTISPECIES: DNA-3-methyladenine glycosylase family protein [Paraburkholderia]|jgi:DNA-3-methyladenine glycosylase II|uniref:DNA-3-methyladenine glycosylase II n=1 Tax=Paraburkholderia caledonica TaxID=134536 RepID=A0AB73ICG1_9BURK|nr:DNA-3-methyladenine glycosylase [Paraburkholderia caledonica]OWJ60450.1 DNA-3-methyladenine glycosylase 2 family protein [Burkholderia sp. Bk]MDP9645962.1 DNA-3-methyladenine glycosylase II [Paraburkholderia caledonica]MDR6374107.1 DNA-3-methyladenine glycosylase II [Paraburkholderia caledonica]CAH2892975.1 MAG: HhH-GPD base excision DNA repair family protein; Probable 3-methyladenine DNA glycosylase/8-oxoguanine DNA glycosylase [uncultured Paraburkholderia sp.]CAH2907789.1 MAG: HhH-GPD bas